jgi:hypothetical protein
MGAHSGTPSDPQQNFLRALGTDYNRLRSGDWRPRNRSQNEHSRGNGLAHPKGHGWTQQLQAVTGELSTIQSDAITPVQSVSQCLAEILTERKGRTKRGLSKYDGEAAEQAAEHREKLGIARNVRDVAAVHSTLWPDSPQPEIFNVAVLIGQVKPPAIPPGEERHVPKVWARATQKALPRP